jgi:Zn-dependent alcohol dehydrogenase
MQEKRLIGSLYGSGQPVVDIPRLVELYRGGKLKLRELVTHSYRLNEVNDALNKLAEGTDARGIIEW